MKQLKIWMDGIFVSFDKANVHVLTHALHYGTACFEGIRAYKTKKETIIFRLQEHIDRLFRSLDALGMKKIAFSKKQITSAIKQLVKKNKLADAYIRPVAFYGYGSVLEVYPKNHKQCVAIIGYPVRKKSRTLRVMTSSFSRVPEHATKYGAKIAGFYANSIMAMHEVRRKGYDEALLLDEQGNVAEGPFQNLFMVKENILATPNSRSILPGVTKSSIQTLGKDLGYRVVEKSITLADVKKADELFYTGTLSEITPIVRVDRKSIGNGKTGFVTKQLMTAFSDVVSGENKKYQKWLTVV